MQDYLVLTLAAPLASFGVLAVGERRPSSDHPTKSQIIGLVAAALGIGRGEEERQRAFAASLGYAVRMDDAGRPASDYHTAEYADEASARKWRKANGPIATRRDELACEKTRTVLSMREYRTGVHATVVLWEKGMGFTSLGEIQEHVQRPRFTLFAGRKAFPLMLPCRPAIIRGASVEDALDAYDAQRSPEILEIENTLQYGRRRRDAPAMLYADADASTRGKHQRIETRRDIPETRAKWGFSLRNEHVLTFTKLGGEQ